MLKDNVANFKSRGGDTDTMNVQCPYCSQILLAEVTPDIRGNKDLQRELGAELCRCPSAQYYTGKKLRLEFLEDNLQETIGKRAAESVDEDVYVAIKQIAKMVCFEEIKKATINLSGTDKLTLQTDSKGKLHINRERKNIKTKTI